MTDAFDLADQVSLDFVRQRADELIAAHRDVSTLRKLEQTLSQNKDETRLYEHLAVKLAISKCLVAHIKDDAFVSVVFAVYKEAERLREKTSSNPHGEDSLRRKIIQLHWLFENSPNFNWELIVVDDGCPDNSGAVAESIISESGAENNVRVLYLKDAISSELSVASGLNSPADSQKGGSILYGMWTAVQKEHPNHAVIFTDADLSTHLGQVGLLVDGVLNRGMRAAIGSRREPTSVVVKKGTRNDRGKLFIYLWKRIIYNLSAVVDTQCGFKAFSASTVRAIVDDMLEKKFAFDIELLLKTELLEKDSVCPTAIAWIDSEALSTTTDLQPYLGMLKAMVAMYRRYLEPNPQSDEFAEFIEFLDDASWQELVVRIPEDIVSREPSEFGDYDAISVDDLRAP